MQTFTIAEILCMTSELMVPEPGEHKRTKDEMLAMVYKFGGSLSMMSLACDNARELVSAEFITACEGIDGTNCEAIRDSLINQFGPTIDLPITPTDGGCFIL